MGITAILNNVADLTNTVTAQSTINSNSNTITTAFTSAYNVTGDTLQGTINVNSNSGINIGALSFAASATSTVNGTIWWDGTNFKARVGGVTKTFTVV